MYQLSAKQRCHLSQRSPAPCVLAFSTVLVPNWLSGRSYVQQIWMAGLQHSPCRRHLQPHSIQHAATSPVALPRSFPTLHLVVWRLLWHPGRASAQAVHG